MSKHLHLFFLLLLLTGSVFAQRKEELILGERVTLPSELLKEDRVLNIYLPPDYGSDSSRTYPVIYLLDGSWDEDFLHVAGLLQFLSFPWIEKAPEAILVGIANVDRQRDFTFPTSLEQDRKDFPTAGHSAEFMAFIEQELKPFIQKNYACSNHSIIIGQSLGGLLATEILFTKPALFNAYFIISPSLWWDNESLLSRPWAQLIVNKTVYIAVGNEGKLMVDPAKKLYRSILKSTDGLNRVHFEYFKDKNHGDVLHQALYNGFEKIYGPPFQKIHPKR